MVEEFAHAAGVPVRRDDTVEIDELSVLHVDPDEAVLAAVETHLDEEYDEVQLVTETDGTAASELLREESFDSLVVAGELDGAMWEAVVNRADCPVILYTDKDPRELDDAKIRAIDTLVEKGNIDRSRQFLSEKLFGVRRPIVEQASQVPDDVVEELGNDIEEAASAFLVDADGDVRWSTASFEETFPVDEVNGTVPENEDFHARVAALLGNDPERMKEVGRLTGSDAVQAGTVLEIETVDETVYYLYYSYPVSPVTNDRFEVFQRVNDVAERYDRLALFEQLVDNAEDGLYVLDADGCLVYCNQSYAEMFGYERSELLGEHTSRWMAEGELEKGQQVVADLMDSNTSSEVVDLTFETKAGAHVHCSVHFSVRVEDGRYAGLMGVVRDITERKERERELEQYRALVDSAGDPMHILDESGQVQMLNGAMADFFGKGKQDIIGRHISELLPPDKVQVGQDAVKQIVSEPDTEFVTKELWLTNADDERRRYEVTVGITTDDEGSFSGSVATFRDITERYQQREELDLLNQVFARVLRHNIRNKASTIQLNAAIIDEDIHGDLNENIDAILRASNTLGDTSEKVQTVNRIVNQGTELVEQDVSTAVAKSLAQVRDYTDGETIEMDVPDDLSVLAIEDLPVALGDLLENALVHGMREDDATVRVSARRDGETVDICIEDDGPGIPESEVRVLQEQRETALEHTSGIGLWLANLIVERSEGDLSFAVENGTRAVVRLEAA